MATDVLKQWAEDMQVRGRTDGTISSYRSSLKAFIDSLGTTNPVQAGEPELKTYLARLRSANASMATIKSHFAAIASLFDFLKHEGRRKDNPVSAFRQRYLDRVKARGGTAEVRRLISIEEARTLVRGTMDIRSRAMLALLLKTGIRREEASMIDLHDIDWKRNSITLKPHAKRTNCVVYFDDETARLLKRWIALREVRGGPAKGPLFTNQRGTRLGSNGIYNIVTDAAARWGLHDANGPIRDRFTPHCCRHWFTTHLRRAGMPDYMIAELRGDAEARTMDIYTHVDHDEVRETYLAKIPQLNL